MPKLKRRKCQFTAWTVEAEPTISEKSLGEIADTKLRVSAPARPLTFTIKTNLTSDVEFRMLKAPHAMRSARAAGDVI